MAIGSRIVEVLERKGWKQADLLRAAPTVGQTTLSQIIARDNSATEVLFELADALGVSARWLQTGVEPPPGVDLDAPQVNVALAQLQKKYDDQQSKIKQIGACLRAVESASEKDKEPLLRLALSLVNELGE